MEEFYDVGRVIGSGGFATVHAAIDRRNNERVALKIVNVKQKVRSHMKELARVNNGYNHNCKDESAAAVIDIDCMVEANEFFSLEKEILALLAREVAVQTSVSNLHSNVVAIHGSFRLSGGSTNKNNLVIAVAMELCTHGDLQMYLKRLRKKREEDRGTDARLEEETKQNDCGKSQLGCDNVFKRGTFSTEAETRHVVRQVLNGLKFLHSRGIVHRDIKPSNIFLSIDFSQSNNLNITDHTHQVVSEGSVATGRSSLTSSFSYCEDNLPIPSLFSSLAVKIMDCTIKIGDFGLAVQMDRHVGHMDSLKNTHTSSNDNSNDDSWNDEDQHTICGTPCCLAPEVARSTSKLNKPAVVSHDDKKLAEANSPQTYKNFEGNNDIAAVEKESEGISATPVSRGHGRPADLWSVGCLMFVMLIGKYPFSANPTKRNDNDNNGQKASQKNSDKRNDVIAGTLARVLEGKWSIPEDMLLSCEALDLLQQLLSSDPTKRGNAADILENHPFLRDHDQLNITARGQNSALESQLSSVSFPTQHQPQHTTDNVTSAPLHPREEASVSHYDGVKYIADESSVVSSKVVDSVMLPCSVNDSFGAMKFSNNRGTQQLPAQVETRTRGVPSLPHPQIQTGQEFDQMCQGKLWNSFFKLGYYSCLQVIFEVFFTRNDMRCPISPITLRITSSW
mmetsp:Transcript_61895/g.72365  ORF Transcript_61895/g.72365 Transcript_61895/m.72365 type:complete len:677 (+) Transcript_61895:85-2115(+)